MSEQDRAANAGQYLDDIRKVFKARTTELAEFFGVSRQAIYDWQAGKSMALENVERLRDLACAAYVVSDKGFPPSRYLFRRLRQIMANYPTAESAAHKLCVLLLAEENQRKRLQARFAGRLADVDFSQAGIPMLDEEAK